MQATQPCSPLSLSTTMNTQRVTMSLYIFTPIKDIFLQHVCHYINITIYNLVAVKCPMPTPWWKRYVDDVICITKKDQVDILFNHINQLDDHIKFTIESLDNEGIIPLLNNMFTPNSNHTTHTTVYRKPTHTDKYLEFKPSNNYQKVSYTSTDPQSQSCLFHPRSIS